jgi:hypothetical protein
MKIIKQFKHFKNLLFTFFLTSVFRLRILLGLPVYYVIGDSHAGSFLNPVFKIYQVGPATAYRLDYENSTTKGREKVLKILNSIYKSKHLNVIFVFGEIDIRGHINKTAIKNKLPVNKVINSTVDSYFNFLQFVKSKYPLINIYVFNVLPQGEEENIYGFQFFATRDKRSAISVAMNKRLKMYANKFNYTFIDIYNYLIDGKGERIKEYVFDKVHYNKKIVKFILKTLK